MKLPAIDVSALVRGETDALVGAEIDRACRDTGFFLIEGHGVDPELLARLDAAAREFFALPTEVKEHVSMSHGGRAWRGWFPLGGELTSGVPDGKEGYYMGWEHGPEHPRVASRTPLHGANLFPETPVDFRPAALEWLDEMAGLATAVMRGVAVGLGLSGDWFEENLTADPTMLLRIFTYPSDDSFEWGVAEHTDYGLLTLLAQDGNDGLQVHSSGQWIDVPADPTLIVCNIGDMLDRLTDGRYRSTPHRVRNATGRSRLSFPFFFDPSWDAEVLALPLDGTPPADDARTRWDGSSVQAWQGTYGDYLSAKVAKVFPELFAEVGD